MPKRKVWWGVEHEYQHVGRWYPAVCAYPTRSAARHYASCLRKEKDQSRNVRGPIRLVEDDGPKAVRKARREKP